MATTYTKEKLDELLEAHRGKAWVKIRFFRECAGGMAADEKGLRAFVQHKMMLVPGTEEFDDAVKRIKNEEIGERELTPEEGELTERTVYQVNVVRRSEHGPYLLDHMIKAMIKLAASRLGIWTKKKSTKGDMTELGSVEATGESLQNPERPWEIYVRNNGGPARTFFETISGTISDRQGRRSIQHDTEKVEEGAEAEFIYRYGKARITKDEMATILSATRFMGLGSCRSLGLGRFEITELVIESD